MTFRIFRNIVLAVIVMAFSFSFAPAAVAAESLTKADVEKIVHDYIAGNPQLILESVDDYQKKTTQAKQDSAMAKNKDTLFNDIDSPIAGNPEGDVTVVEFFDYNCHYCKSALPIVQALLEKDKKIRFVLKDFPILGPSSETAAKWALAAQKQKKYFEFYKAMMNNKSPIDDALLEKTAKDVGMNVEQAKKDIDGTGILLQIEKNRSLANNLGLNGTPAFIVGSDIIPGVASVEELEKRVAEQRKAKAGGTAKN